jgi:NAD+--dinitrogen-reductase ADP-D-ribosyltransferase
VNHLAGHEALAETGPGRAVVLLNSLNSFTAERERADEFGDRVLAVSVPLAKVLFFHDLLPGALRGEAEYGVIGGVYEVVRAA